jgi:hypothetical protein
MGIEDFTAPLIDPFKNALGPLQNLIEGHRTNHQDMLNLVNSLLSAAHSGDGIGDLFSGLTATSVQDATQRLVQMSEQRMGAMDQMVSGFSNAASSATSAVEGVVNAFLPTDLLDKVLSHFDIVGVIMNGKSIVQEAIDALLQTFLDELKNPFSALVDIAEGAIEMLTGIFPATLLPWGAEVFQLAQEVIQVINMVETLLSTLQSLSTPVQELFSEIGQQTTTLTKDGLGILGAIAAINMGVVGATPNALSTVGQSAGAQAVGTLNQGPGAGPNQIGSTPTPLPGLGNTMNEYAKIIVNTPQGQETMLVPITSQPVQVAIGGAPTSSGATSGGQITITISGTQAGAIGGVQGAGGLTSGAPITAGGAVSLNPQPLPPGYSAPAGTPISGVGGGGGGVGSFGGGGYGGGGGGYGGGGFVAPPSVPPSVPLGNGGYSGDVSSLGTAILGAHAPIGGTAIVGAQSVGGGTMGIGYSAAGNIPTALSGGTSQMIAPTGGVRSDGSGSMFTMPPMMMGGGFGGAPASSDDEDK